MELVHIRNSRPSMVVLPPVKDETGAQTFPEQRLIPGDNAVGAAYFKAIEGRKDVKALFGDGEGGILEVIAASKSAPLIPADALKTLMSTSPKHAIGLVLSCSNPDQLGDWAGVEKRAEVLKAIGDRLAVLDKATKA